MALSVLGARESQFCLLDTSGPGKVVGCGSVDCRVGRSGDWDPILKDHPKIGLHAPLDWDY